MFGRLATYSRIGPESVGFVDATQSASLAEWLATGFGWLAPGQWLVGTPPLPTTELDCGWVIRIQAGVRGDHIRFLHGIGFCANRTPGVADE